MNERIWWICDVVPSTSLLSSLNTLSVSVDHTDDMFKLNNDVQSKYMNHQFGVHVHGQLKEKLVMFQSRIMHGVEMTQSCVILYATVQFCILLLLLLGSTIAGFLCSSCV